ncbi:hypothetical protein VPNG_04094 [Cytospora leucostoma]|uniref:Major facilitator superfamily (MFS) profile domain-containing protein n=1 Tax=Cytospora leucostoma TaxID=1230097 RepID=A0A423XDB2_9PEZI|nr:hypothetical protein VPNG_04094 [Cytospora leucostoma]
MEAAFITQLVAVQSAPASLEPVATPRPARILPTRKAHPTMPTPPSSIELGRVGRRPATAHPPGSLHRRPDDDDDDGLVVARRPESVDADLDLEMSRPASPAAAVVDDAGHADDGVEALQSVWDPYMNRFRLMSVCLINFLNGLSDSASGPLIPYMEKYYEIGYAIVSLIFVGQAVGFITGAGLIDPMRLRLGRARSFAIAQVLMAGGYVAIACTAPFPAVVCAFFLVGLGMSINLALGNTFCGGLAGSTTALGAMHGSYGIGGVTGPLIATALVTVGDTVWSRFYLLTLGLSVLTGFLALWSYCHYERDHPDAAVSGPTTAPGAASRIAGLLEAFRSRVVILGALFIFAYQGAEVSISGWVISFLEETRKGDPSSVGYVTSGFWGGITLGRFILSVPAHRVGEKVFVHAVVAGAAVFELLVWLVPNVVGDAVSVSIVGLLLGPVYPCAAAIFMRTMSRTEKLSGMGFISAFGSSGGAAAPFTTGILAQAAGTFVLHPIAIGLFGVMLSGLALHSISRSSLCCLLSSRALSSADAQRLPPPKPAMAPDTSKSAASSLTVVRRAFCAWNPRSLSLCSRALLACASSSSSLSLSFVRGLVKGRGVAATSALLCASRSAACFSRPRSARSSLIIDCTSDGERSGAPQPSLRQTTLPHSRQFGAAFCRGWRVATQLQRRAETSSRLEEERDGFVVTSRERMAASRSATAVEAPCMGVPPVREILVVCPLLLPPPPPPPPPLVEDGPGVELREAGPELGFCFGARRSETSEPAADGGGLLGFWFGGGVEVFGVGALDGTLLPAGVDAPDLPPLI